MHKLQQEGHGAQETALPHAYTVTQTLATKQTSQHVTKNAD